MDGWMDEFQVVIDGHERAIVGFHRIKSSRDIHVPSRGVFGIFSLLFFCSLQCEDEKLPNELCRPFGRP